MATTSKCPSKDCEKHSLGVAGTLDPDAKCGSRLDGCFIKEIGRFHNYADFKSNNNLDDIFKIKASNKV